MTSSEHRYSPQVACCWDLHMPGMAGLELLDTLHARGSKLPVIVVTGRSDAVLKERVARAGALVLLDKPVADDTLLSSLTSALSLAECRER